jgi:xylitol oxidase
MKKRTFLKLSSACLMSPLFPLSDASAQGGPIANWAGNLRYGTDRLDQPASAAEVQQVVRTHRRLKVLGTRHCFNGIADSTDRLVSLARMNRVVSLDPQARQVTVEGGVTYGQLCPYLHEKGFALHNLASLPHISVVGACATATHGSGVGNGNLATAVTGLELVTADGSLVTLSLAHDAARLRGAVVGLGALGVVTKVTLAVQPTFLVRQVVYEHLPMAAVKDRFGEIMSAGYSVSLFTDWQRDTVNEVWVKRRLDRDAASDAAEFFGARRATKNLHPIAELSAEHCTEQMGVPGPWHERLPHFRMGFTPSSGKELQAEYFVPSRHAVEAILAVARLAKQIGPHLLISEIRTVAADELWMSPCYREASVAIHFTWKQDWPAVSALLPVIERELTPFTVRPHWGKLFGMAAPAPGSTYERLADFRTLAAELDPDGKFRNDFLNRHVYGQSNRG